MSQSNGTIYENSNDNHKENVQNGDKQSLKNGNNTFDLMNGASSTAVPQYGIKLKFNHTFPEKRTQNLRPSFRQSISLIPLAWR